MERLIWLDTVADAQRASVDASVGSAAERNRRAVPDKVFFDRKLALHGLIGMASDYTSQFPGRYLCFRFQGCNDPLERHNGNVRGPDTNNNPNQLEVSQRVRRARAVRAEKRQRAAAQRGVPAAKRHRAAAVDRTRRRSADEGPLAQKRQKS